MSDLYAINDAWGDEWEEIAKWVGGWLVLIFENKKKKLCLVLHISHDVHLNIEFH